MHCWWPEEAAHSPLWRLQLPFGTSSCVCLELFLGVLSHVLLLLAENVHCFCFLFIFHRRAARLRRPSLSNFSRAGALGGPTARNDEREEMQIQYEARALI